jgi:opacity protein-like surface antigen
MTTMSKIFIGAAGLTAALTIALPAAAQQPYPYSNQNSGIVGAIINSVTGGGYGQYPQGNYGYGQVDERAVVGMCAAAAEQRINSNYRGQPGYGYNNGYASNGYQQGYANGYNGQNARVLGITNVERRNSGSLKVTGVASSGRGYGYGNQSSNNQGYNNGYNGQRAYPANQSADLRFTCKVNSRGQVSDLNISRNQVAYRGY